MRKKVLLVMGFVVLVSIVGSVFYIKNTQFKKQSEPSNAQITAQIKSIISTEGSETAWKYLKTNYPYAASNQASLSNSIFDLHLVAHYIGAQVYKEKGVEGIAVCDTSFGYGCYHGFVAELLSTEGVSSIKKIDALCSKLDNPGACIHGVGHGLSDLEGLNFTKALEGCDSFENKFARECWGGVFMEYHFNVGRTNATTLGLTWQPCDQLTEKYQTACAESKPYFLSTYYHKDIPYISHFCTTAPTSEMQRSCLDMLQLAIIVIDGGDTKKIIADCLSLPTEYKDTCLINAAQSTQDIATETKKNKISDICNAVSKGLRESCELLLIKK